jgi:hypothetical protein
VNGHGNGRFGASDFKFNSRLVERREPAWNFSGEIMAAILFEASMTRTRTIRSKFWSITRGAFAGIIQPQLPGCSKSEGISIKSPGSVLAKLLAPGG